MWDPTAKKIDDKALLSKIPKAEMKTAMPFVQGLKRRLQSEDADKVLDRKLAFDEQATLLAMVSGIKRTAGCHSIEVVLVEEKSKKGVNLTDGDKEVEVKEQAAEKAVPGEPTFTFENVKA